jgi:hypothetical protein
LQRLPAAAADLACNRCAVLDGAISDRDVR